MSTPNIISLGELLVEIMRVELDTPHDRIGQIYRGPFPSGAPAIFINSAARMGKHFNLSTGFIGVVGNDEFGSCIKRKLEKDGVDVSRIRIEDRKTTGIAFNQYNSDGSRKFIFSPGAAGETSINDLDEAYFKNVKNLHVMGSALSISENSKKACYKAIEITLRQNPEAIISFDPNLRPEMLPIDKIIEISRPVLEKTKILLPSGEEAEMLAQVKGEQQACRKLLELGIELVILKQGKQGCTIFMKEKSDPVHIKGFKARELDPTGAGDSFGGAFMATYLAGLELEEAARFANAVGALKVEFFGPMPDTTFEEVLEFMEKAKLI
ncbi:MAG: carbohydrate kinase family protein [Promethearchaeota archaeon]